MNNSSGSRNFLIGLIFILIATIIGIAAIGASTENNPISDLWDKITGNGSDPDNQTANNINLDDEDLLDEDPNLIELALGISELSTFVDVVNTAELTETFSDETVVYTLFVPNNDAFSEIQDTLDSLSKPENLSDLTTVLTFHAVGSEIFLDELEDGQIIESLNGNELTVQIDGEDIILIGPNGEASIIKADVEGKNGVIHIIDAVLLPDLN